MNTGLIIKLVRESFPTAYVEVVPFGEFDCEYEVRCYGVDRTMFRNVRRRVIAINRELFPDDEADLVSVLYTNEETRKNFPQIATLIPSNSPSELSRPAWTRVAATKTACTQFDEADVTMVDTEYSLAA
jgi:hypothetical protein